MKGVFTMKIYHIIIIALIVLSMSYAKDGDVVINFPGAVHHYAGVGSCPYGYGVQNTTSDGVDCILLNGTVNINATKPGTCPAGYAVQNTTSGGVECVLISFTETDPISSPRVSALNDSKCDIGTCPAGYVLQNCTAHSFQCVLLPTFTSSVEIDQNVNTTGSPSWQYATAKEFIASVSYQNITGLQTSMVSYYTFDNDTIRPGLVLDTLNRHNITQGAGTVTNRSGLINNAVNFNGQASGMGSINDFNLSSNWTINAWLKIGTFPTVVNRYFMGNAFSACWDFRVGTYSNNETLRVSYQACGSTLMTIPEVFNSSWVMYSITTNETNTSLYMNGAYRESFMNEVYPAGFDKIFYLGGAGGTVQGWNVTFDEMGLWNRSLTSSEITSLYNSGNGLSFPFQAQLSNKTILTYEAWNNNNTGIGVNATSIGVDVNGNFISWTDLTNNNTYFQYPVRFPGSVICNMTDCYSVSDMLNQTNTSGYVPYNGATNNLNMGANRGINAKNISTTDLMKCIITSVYGESSIEFSKQANYPAIYANMAGTYTTVSFDGDSMVVSRGVSTYGNVWSTADTGTYDLGKSTKYWNNTYSKNFIGNGSRLTDVCLSNGSNCVAVGNTSFNQSLTDTLYIKNISNIQLGSNNITTTGTGTFGTSLTVKDPTPADVAILSYYTEGGGYLGKITLKDNKYLQGDVVLQNGAGYLDIVQGNTIYGFLIHRGALWGGQGITTNGDFAISASGTTKGIQFFSNNFNSGAPTQATSALEILNNNMVMRAGGNFTTTGTGTFGSTYQAVLGNDLGATSGRFDDGTNHVYIANGNALYWDDGAYSSHMGGGVGFTSNDGTRTATLTDGTYAINAIGGIYNIGSDGSSLLTHDGARVLSILGIGGVYGATIGDGTSEVNIADGTYAINAGDGTYTFTMGGSAYAGTFTDTSSHSVSMADGNTALYATDGTAVANLAYNGYAGTFENTPNSVYLASTTYAITEVGDILYDGSAGVDDTYDDGTDTQITFTNGGATAISTAYDISLMKDIEYLNKDVDNKLKLVPVKFKWNTEGLNQFSNSSTKTDYQIGYIAQDVQKFYPDCIVQDKLKQMQTTTRIMNKTGEKIEITKAQAFETIQEPIKAKVNTTCHKLDSTIYNCTKEIATQTTKTITKLKKGVEFDKYTGKFYTKEIIQEEQINRKQVDTATAVLNYNKNCLNAYIYAETLK